MGWIVPLVVLFGMAAMASAGIGGGLIIGTLVLFAAACLLDYRLRQARVEIARLLQEQEQDRALIAELGERDGLGPQQPIAQPWERRLASAPQQDWSIPRR